jgi:hypothetical protein
MDTAFRSSANNGAVRLEIRRIRGGGAIENRYQ